MRRREFIAIAGGAAAAWRQEARAQSKLARLGRLSPLSRASDRYFTALQRGLSALGWTEGDNIAFEYRFADGQVDRLPGLATQLVQLGVDVIVAGSDQGALAARSATETIPIVMVTTGDPLTGHIIDSLARPGRNLTGVTALGVQLTQKRLELLKDAFPGIEKVAVLAESGSPYAAHFLAQRNASAQSLGLQIELVEIRSQDELSASFAEMKARGAQAVLVLGGILLFTHRKQVVERANEARVPTIYTEREFVRDGGLMWYGASLPDMYFRAATHVDRILRGARARDIPVEQPTKFDLVLNLRAARALGIVLPPLLLARADEVIE